MTRDAESGMGEGSRLSSPVHGSPSVADLLSCTFDYEEYFDDAHEQPEADIRPRFLAQRNFRAKFAELKVRSEWNVVRKLRLEWRGDASQRKAKEQELETAMEKFNEALHKYS